jgi:hypothetical protein
MSPASSAMVLEQFTGSQQKSTKQYALETRICGSSVQRILKHANLEVYTLSLLHAANEQDPDRRFQFYKWCQHRVHEDEDSLVWWSNI